MANLCSGRGRAQQRRENRQERRDDRRERRDDRREEAKQRAEERKLERHSISNEHGPLRNAVRGLLGRSNHTSGNHAKGDTQHQTQTQRMNTTMNQDGSVTASLTLPRGVRPDEVIVQAKVNINGAEQTYPVRLARGKANTEFHDRKTQEKFCKISSSRQADGSQRYTVDLYNNVSEATIRMQGHAAQTINTNRPAEKIAEKPTNHSSMSEILKDFGKTSWAESQPTPPRMTAPQVNDRSRIAELLSEFGPKSWAESQDTAPRITPHQVENQSEAAKLIEERDREMASASRQDNIPSSSDTVKAESSEQASSPERQQKASAPQESRPIESSEVEGLNFNFEPSHLLKLIDASQPASLDFSESASTSTGEQKSAQEGQQKSSAPQEARRIQSFTHAGFEFNYANSSHDSSVATEQPMTDSRGATQLNGLKVEIPDLSQQIQTTEATSNSRPTAYTNSSLLRNDRLIFDRATLRLKPEQSVPSLQDWMSRPFRIE